MIQSNKYEIHIGKIFNMSTKLNETISSFRPKQIIIISQEQCDILTQFTDIRRDSNLNITHTINNCEFSILPHFEVNEESSEESKNNESKFDMNSYLKKLAEFKEIPLKKPNRFSSSSEKPTEEKDFRKMTTEELFDYLTNKIKGCDLKWEAHYTDHMKVGEEDRPYIPSGDFTWEKTAEKEQFHPKNERMTVGKLRQMLSVYNDDCSVSLENKDDKVYFISSMSLLKIEGTATESFTSIKILR